MGGLVNGMVIILQTAKLRPSDFLILVDSYAKAS